MEKLCCSLSFIHRNGMPTMLVYGPDPHSFSHHLGNTERKELIQTEMKIVDTVEKFHGKIRAFCGSNGIIYSKIKDPTRYNIIQPILHLAFKSNLSSGNAWNKPVFLV